MPEKKGCQIVGPYCGSNFVNYLISLQGSIFLFLKGVLKIIQDDTV